MDILKLLGTALAWVSGVVAGITAILYALGFAATVAHQRMLGVNWGVIARDPLWYLGAGGQVLVAWLAEAMVVFFVVVVAGECILRLIRWLTQRQGRFTRPVASLAGWIDRHVVWLVALLAMIVTGFLTASMTEALAIKNLLLAEPSTTCAANGIAAALLDFDEAALAERSADIAWFSALAVGVGAYAVPRLAAGNGPGLPLLICIAVAINAVLAVPISHGILKVDTRWQSVAGDGVAIAAFPEAALRLLGRTPDGIWAWDPDGRAVHLFVTDSFKHLQIGPARTIRELLDCEVHEAARKGGTAT